MTERPDPVAETCMEGLEALSRHVLANERWLMERILSYAKARDYTQYTSTLVEAWRVSIQGLSEALVTAVRTSGSLVTEFGPHDRLDDDPAAAFGLLEARRHRERGVSLQMFLGLFKYYRQSFVDLVRGMDAPEADRQYFEQFVVRCFDRIELAFCTQWAELGSDAALAELQDSNRRMTNEKNKYLTLFESQANPVFLMDSRGALDNMNLPAACVLGLVSGPGESYYGRDDSLAASVRGRPLAELLPWLGGELEAFASAADADRRFEVCVEPGERVRCYEGSLTRMQDISGRYSGAVLVLYDLTDHYRAEEERKMKDRLQGVLEMAVSTAHEFSQPLQALTMDLSFLLEQADGSDEDVSEALESMRDSMKRLQELIRKVQNVTEYKVRDYVGDVRMVDLD